MISSRAMEIKTDPLRARNNLHARTKKGEQGLPVLLLDLHLSPPKAAIYFLKGRIPVRSPLSYWAVKISGPSGVIATVCSYCADNLPSAVLAVH